MGRTDVFPEVGAAKHPVSQPGEFQPKILEPPWQKSCMGLSPVFEWTTTFCFVSLLVATSKDQRPEVFVFFPL